MGLDIARLLTPASGLVSDVMVVAPKAREQPWWRVAARLACEHNQPRSAESDALGRDAEVILCSTGACAVSRSAATIRCAGEAVERTALHPGSAAFVGTATDASPAPLRFFADGAALAENPDDRELRWYPARRLVDGSTYLVPAGLIDYPAADPDCHGFDPGPSGSAAAVSSEDSLRRALLETVERDAIISAWDRQLRLRHIEPYDILAACAESSAAPTLQRALHSLEAAGLEPVFREVPVSIPGLRCVVGGSRAEGHGHDLISLGAGLDTDLVAAMSGALQESFQLLTGLRIFQGHQTGADWPVRTEEQRMRWLASPDGCAAVESWIADPVPAAPADIGAPLSADQMLKLVILDGLDPYLAGLADRLPQVVRSMGWRVTSVVPVGYQPLRIDEQTEFGWNRSRLESLERRTGVEARHTAARPFDYPHPLP